MNNMGKYNGIGRNQLVGNAGLYYVCYELSKRGWNAMPTSRNARGVDVVIYNQKGSNSHTIQVKALSKRSPVPFGKTLSNLIAEYVVVVTDIFNQPKLYIVDTPTVKSLIHEGLKDGRRSYWFQPNDYEQFKDNWSLLGNPY
ncbi:hypothetical protein HS7_15940 [Sulfolobales archaeon HS-7]|nr:hypothetical protein HS7_15940 [Sulfolobales archaeon HS-7]